jgi:hypothetical protein
MEIMWWEVCDELLNFFKIKKIKYYAEAAQVLQ